MQVLSPHGLSQTKGIKMETSTEKRIAQLFDQLDIWRHLPAYQLERRADIFFSLYLPEVLQRKFGLDEPPVLIPEFPCHFGTVDPKRVKGKNQSFKIDYLALGEKKDVKTQICKKVAYFVELKTDNKSFSDNQHGNMKMASQLPIKDLIVVLPEMQKNSNEKSKYACLIKKVESFSDWNVKPTVVYVTPGPLTRQPKEGESKPEHIPFMSPSGAAMNEEISVYEVVSAYKDAFSLRFAQSLESWATTAAGAAYP